MILGGGGGGKSSEYSTRLSDQYSPHLARHHGVALEDLVPQAVGVLDPDLRERTGGKQG